MDIYLPKIKINFTAEEGIILSTFVAKHFTEPLLSVQYNFKSTIKFLEPELLYGFDVVMKGRPIEGGNSQNHWAVYKNGDDLAIEIIYNDNEFYNRTISVLSLHNNEFTVYLDLKSTVELPVIIDPFDPAFSSLNMFYISIFTDGFLVHASGVYYNEIGHLFTAVSGTGKSTMAKLWDKRGATLVNDDRLWITQHNGEWYMANTPMVWYAQYPRVTPIHSVYLLRQSPTNELTKLSGIKPAMQFMSNCPQHHFDKDMSSNFLDRVIDFTSNMDIYDLGFKPDQEVVDLLIS